MNCFKAMLVKVINRAVRGIQVLLFSLSFNRLPPFCSVLALIVENGSIYVIFHKVHGYYTFPGGYLQVGETPAEGIKREVFEETGIKATPVKIIGCYENRTGMHSINIVYLCESEGIGRELSYEGKSMWMKIEDVYSKMPSHCQDALDDYKIAKY